MVTGYFDVSGRPCQGPGSCAQATGAGVPSWSFCYRDHDPLLSGPARAEFVAGLGMVDYVVTETRMAAGGVFGADLPADKVISRQAADEEQTRF